MQEPFVPHKGNESLPQQLSVPYVLLLSIPALVIILLTIFGNLLVLFFKARVGRTNTTLLVWNLGLTDFLVGVFVLPLGAIHLIHRKWAFGHLICRLWVGADVTFCTCSVVTICIISVDRYLAVTRPLRYKGVVTKTKVVIVIILIWTFSLGILLATVRYDYLPGANQNKTCYAGDEIRYLAHSVVFAFFIPASVTLTLYWRVYKLARNRQKALNRGFLMILGHNMNFLTSTLSQATALRVHVGKNNGVVEHQRRVLRNHERIAKTLGVVSCSFLFCWLPFFTLYLINYKCLNCIPPLIIDIASWLGYCNSMLNPIIYSFTVKEFKRSAFAAILPAWNFVHNWCPGIVKKPPDPKTTQRITRKRQQQITQKSKSIPSTFYNDRKRITPPRDRPKSAIAQLMISANSSIVQNSLTSAAMLNQRKWSKREEEEEPIAEEKEGEEVEEEEKKVMTNGVNREAIDVPREERKRSGLADNWSRRERIEQLKLRFRRGSCQDPPEGKLFNNNGLVTATLLLATTEKFCKKQEELRQSNLADEISSLPMSPTLSSMGSDLNKPMRMPCKVSVKRLKRHSLPDTSVASVMGTSLRKSKKKKLSELRSGQKSSLFSAFKRATTAGEVNRVEDAVVERNSSPTGIWQKATSRALALRKQWRMSGSSSHGSLSSKKKRKVKKISSSGTGGGREDVSVQLDTSTNTQTYSSEVVGANKSRGWNNNAAAETRELTGTVRGGGNNREETRLMNGENREQQVGVQIICTTDSIEL